MTERVKRYTLPDLAPAPTSEIGALARNLIEYADLASVPAILDHLSQMGRVEQRQALLDWVTHSAAPVLRDEPRPWHKWDLHAGNLVRLFWHDLFDLGAALALIEADVAKNQSVRFSAGWDGPRALRVAGDLREGEYGIVRDGEIHPAPAPTIPEAGWDAATQLIAQQQLYDNGPCKLPPDGWFCTRPAGHDGPCAAHPTLSAMAAPGFEET